MGRPTLICAKKRLTARRDVRKGAKPTIGYLKVSYLAASMERSELRHRLGDMALKQNRFIKLLEIILHLLGELF